MDGKSRGTGKDASSSGTEKRLAGVLADYFESLDLSHPQPLPPLPGEDPDMERLQVAMSLAMRKIESAFVDMRRYTSNVSHELLNPLSVIKGKAEVTLLRPRANDFYEKKLAEIIEHSVAMKGMIDALLELSRLELTEELHGIELLDLRDVADLACQRLNPLFNRRGQQVEKQASHAPAKGRKALLLTVATNLLDNASKYSPPGGRLGIKTYREDSTGESVLEVWDTGPGMSQEEIDQCFDLFWRADGSRHMPGYGIGLPLVYRIAQLHGAKIEMRSGPREGLLFRIRFPNAASNGAMEE